MVKKQRQESAFEKRFCRCFQFGRYENVQLVEIGICRPTTKEDERIILKYIDFLQLSDLENRYLDELSGGQRQRAYVAMVLTQETEYVLLDEPLNNLDVARSVQMMEHLKHAANEFGRTILTVMHNINFAAKYSDRICAMKTDRFPPLVPLKKS